MPDSKPMCRQCGDDTFPPTVICAYCLGDFCKNHLAKINHQCNEEHVHAKRQNLRTRRDQIRAEAH